MKTKTTINSERIKYISIYTISVGLVYATRMIDRLVPLTLILGSAYLIHHIANKIKIKRNCKKLMVYAMTPEQKQELILEEATIIGNINKEIGICLIGCVCALINPFFIQKITINPLIVSAAYSIGIKLFYLSLLLLSIAIVIGFYKLLKLTRIV